MANEKGSKPNFGGLGVAAFESRRADEIATLISRFGGVPHVGPSMREVPLGDNPAVFEFGEQLLAGKIQGVVFTTGVGTRTLFEALQSRYAIEEIVHGLTSTTVVARGPKPAQALREFGVPITITAPEPNTWQEVLQELDENPRSFTLKGSTVAVQEYGEPNEAFLGELRSRGAVPLRVPVYRWALPENLGPLKETINTIIAGRARVALFTSRNQVANVLHVAAEEAAQDALLKALRQSIVCSIGPTCSGTLVAAGIPVDVEALPPRMGVLVLEAARQAPDLLRRKQPVAGPSGGVPDGERFNVAAGAAVTEAARVASPYVASGALENSRFMKACRREPVDATPVWLMRQAGRFMKEYRELRARVPFLELCKSPDLVAEVTVSAARKLGVDAAIIFADLLLIIEPLGLELEYGKGEGPIISPAFRKSGDLDRLRTVNPEESLGYLYEAIRRTRAALPPDLPLIGFAGAPFTVASYMIEGGASKTFRHTKTLMYRDEGAWRALMERLSREMAKYVNAQITAGVQAVQIFDSWVGCLGPEDYRRFVLPYTRLLLQGITPGTPVIHFGTGTGMFLEEMRDAGGDIIGLDFHVELGKAWDRLGDRVGVQGNLDPVALYVDLPFIKERVREILDQAAGRPGHIFNLGHGILPDTPEENVIALVKLVHELSTRRN
ncbi:MAG: uroporphyrinogen decarboxylase [Acidobacteria bacterium]|nr:MAG: uroporphyrinogen decarboxylase [Acidobacteriota bacterium]